MYLVAIVGIVAAIGIVVLLMGAGGMNITGQAYAKSSFTAKGLVDCDTGEVFDKNKAECIATSVGNVPSTSKTSSAGSATGCRSDQECCVVVKDGKCTYCSNPGTCPHPV